jgi:hypothetical protein
MQIRTIPHKKYKHLRKSALTNKSCMRVWVGGDGYVEDVLGSRLYVAPTGVSSSAYVVSWLR